jgi:type I restriction enzyme, S subunit
MSSSWPARTVLDLQKAGILRVEDGNHGESRPRPAEFSASGVVFIRAADMVGSEVDFAGAERINDVAFARITKGIGQPLDIIFSHKGTVGKLALVPEGAPPFVCSPQTTFWRTLDESVLDRQFLYAFMRSRLFRDQWRSRKGETDMADYVSLTAQRSFQVPIPSVDEQYAIALRIQPIERQITNLRALRHAVHALAESIFRQWFVARDGGPPGRDHTTIQWNDLALTDLATYRNGIAMQKFPPNGEMSLPVIKIAQLRDGHVENADSVTAEVPEPVHVFNGDVLFSWSGTLMVRMWAGGDAALNQHLFKVTSDCYPKWLYYFWTRTHLPEFRAIAADKKTTMGHIKRHHLADARVAVPEEATLAAADLVLRPMVDRVVLCEVQARRLEVLRDHVLRALMSGRLALGDLLATKTAS